MLRLLYFFHWDPKFLLVLTDMVNNSQGAIVGDLSKPNIFMKMVSDDCLPSNREVKYNRQNSGYDTIARNAGRVNSACTNLEKMFNRDLLNLRYCHQICGLVLRT